MFDKAKKTDAIQIDRKHNRTHWLHCRIIFRLLLAVLAALFDIAKLSFKWNYRVDSASLCSLSIFKRFDFFFFPSFFVESLLASGKILEDQWE